MACDMTRFSPTIDDCSSSMRRRSSRARDRGARGAARRWTTPGCARTSASRSRIGKVAGGRFGRDAARSRFAGADEIDCNGGVLTPGFVDSHTHGDLRHARAIDEQEMRAAGMDYMEIARRGGGIHSSVRDLRQRSEDELFRSPHARLTRLASFGTTTVEVKSGYGLTLDDELKTLRVIARLSPRAAVAHRSDVPRRARDSARASRVGGDASRVRRSRRPRDDSRRRARTARDASPTSSARPASTPSTRAARSSPRRATPACCMKLHADELTSAGGAELAASLGATSADHLAAVSDDGIAALAQGTTVATLLPGTMLFLGKPKQAPARRFIEAGVPVALATDFNPGHVADAQRFADSHPGGQPTSDERRRGGGGSDCKRGCGARAWPTRWGRSHRAFRPTSRSSTCAMCGKLPYWYGDNRCLATWVGGKPCHSSDLGIT